MPNFHTGLEKNPANYTPLTPIDFIERTASIYPDQTAIVYKDYKTMTYGKVGAKPIIAAAKCQMP